jgi:uncharacterized membrane protein
VSFKDNQNNLSPIWLYRLYYTSVVVAKVDTKVVLGDDFIFPTNPTNIHMRYIETKYYYQSDSTLSIESYKRLKKRTIIEAFSTIETAQKRTFDRRA